MKSIKILAGAALIATLFTPAFSYAQSVSDLRVQIAALMQQIQALQAQIKIQQSGEKPAQFCHDFNKSLRVGDQGKEVAALQSTLSKEGFGVGGNEERESQFGEITAASITGFQEKYRDEILTPSGLKYGTGFAGSATRAKLNKVYGCGIIMPPVSGVIISSLSPSSGLVGTKVVISGSGFSEKGNTVNFGYGAIPNLVPDNGKLIFAVPDALNPSCSFLEQPCLLLSRKTTPGVYPVSVTNSKGVSKSLNFTVTSASDSGAPVISGVSGPTALNVGEKGIWTMTASDPGGATLYYSVSWGDENVYLNKPAAAEEESDKQTATFTHAYKYPGTYSPKFMVTNRRGSAETSVSVVVGSALPSAVTISSLSPQSGQVGTMVYINGDGFTPANNTVNFGSGVITGLPAVQWLAATDRLIYPGTSGWTIAFTVPPYLDPACRHSIPACAILSRPIAPGVYPVSVTNENGNSNKVNFSVVGITPSNTPHITGAIPQSGPIGTKVTINGANFISGSKVNFGSLGTVDGTVSSNGTSFTFNVPSAIYAAPGCSDRNSPCAQAVIEVGSGTYLLSVVNGNGTSNEIKFEVTNAPTMSITSPGAGDEWGIGLDKQIIVNTDNMPSTVKYDIVLYSATSGNYPPVIFLQNNATLPSPLKVTVPSVPVGSYYVYARAVIGSAVYEARTANFEIVK